MTFIDMIEDYLDFIVKLITASTLTFSILFFNLNNNYYSKFIFII